MANIRPIDLDAYHDAVLAAIRTQFPLFATVEDYPEDRKAITTPACLLEIEEMDGSDDDDPGTNQQAMKMKVSVRIILGFRTQQVRRTVRRLAGEFCGWLRLQKFGFSVNGARVIGAYQDAFDPGLDQYEVWRVEWEQTAYFGANVWAPDGSITPQKVYVGFAPDIGPEHKDDYIQVAP